MKCIWNYQQLQLKSTGDVSLDVILPDGAERFPTIVLRTPYSRGYAIKRWLRFAESGYALVVVDVHGRGDSGGSWTPFHNDKLVAGEIIEWAAAQPWSTGKVGMVGGSYEGLTQWWTVKSKPKSLACIAPQCVGSKFFPRGNGDTGIPTQYWIWWFHYVNGRTTQYPGAASWEAGIDQLPLKTLDKKFGLETSAWQRYVADEIEAGCSLGSLSGGDFANIDIPVLITNGWWDDQTTMDTWQALQQAKSADDCRLLIGGWDHAGNMGPRPVLGGVDMSASMMDTIAYIEKFLAMHLKGEVNELSKAPRCRVFNLGKQAWQDLPQWPQPQARPTPFYLSSQGDAKGLKGNGRLLIELPGAGQDTYTYDPNHPARDVGNLNNFAWSDPPLDHRYLQRRPDILVYSTYMLETDLTLSGRVTLNAFVASDCVDTDLYVGIYDVHPDGRAIGLFATNEPKGGLRLRYRNGPEEELLEPHTVYSVAIPGPWVQHTFKAGHRLRITVHSNDFPFAARNAGSGLHWAEDTVLYPQTNTLYYGPDYPSHVALPVVPEHLPKDAVYKETQSCVF